MDDRTFQIRIFTLIAAVAITIILSVGGCNIHHDRLLVRAIESGADPIIAKTALEYGATTMTDAAKLN